MQRMLTIPMLANHRHDGCGRPYEARHIEAVVTGDRRTRRGRPKRFDHHHRLQARPLRQLREGLQVGAGPASTPSRATVRVIAGITAVLGSTPGQRVCDVLMKVLLDRGVRLFVMALSGEEIVTTLGLDLPSDGRLPAHGIDGHHTTFDGYQV
jgi:hypothetical protein